VKSGNELLPKETNQIMPQPTPITKQTHTNKSWSRFLAYTFAAKDNLAFLAGAEIAKAVSDMPMAFLKQKDRFYLVAVLSLTPGTNLFVAPNGRWLGKYIPSVFRSYPFLLAKVKGYDTPVLCVDEDSGLVHDDQTVGEPFFDETGEVSKPVKEILNFLNQVEQNRTATNLAVASLAEAGVLTEWTLKIKDGDQEKTVTGLYRIDESKLNALEDEPFLKTRKAGALPIAYAQLLSMGNMQNLAQLAKVREQMAQAQRKEKDPDIPTIFGGSDMFSFE
jgi:hypothetical protein